MGRFATPLLIAAVIAGAPGKAAQTTETGPFDHRDWSSVLARFVDDQGRVDYEALDEDRRELDLYLEQIAETGPRTTPERFPTRADELAYYVNAYNALVFQGVIDGDLENAETVWKGILPGYGFFVGKKFRLDGQSINLRNLENKIVRARYGDARIHAALNCASVGCPRLPTTAFEPGRLETELNAAMAEFVSNEQHVRIDAASRTVYLSKIFDWYEDDFIEDESEA